MSERYFHGGIPGLRPGNRLEGGQQRPVHAGCQICAARARGKVATVAGIPIDMPSGRPDRIYITTDKDYARFYASLYGRGDLYLVDPVGEIEPSPEDHFPTWTVEAAVVVEVYQAAVLLTTSQRRRLQRRWEEADARALTTATVR